MKELIKVRISKGSITFNNDDKNPTIFDISNVFKEADIRNRHSYLNYKPCFHKKIKGIDYYIIKVYFSNGEYIRTL